MFFSSPPLRASVGLGDCGLLGTDPNGLRGRPYDSTQAMTSIKKFMPFSPNCVRWLVLPTYKTTSDGTLYDFGGLDALGTWWYGSTFSNDGKLIHGEEPGTDDSSWLNKAVNAVANAVIKYGIPIVAAALATTGVGAIGAVALLAWRNLAMGQSLTDAILNAQQEKLATTSTYALDAFNQGLAKAKAGLTDAALKAVAKELPTGGDVLTKPAEAFFQAVQLVRAQQTQDLTVAALSTKLSNDEMNRVRLALKWGAPLSDVMAGVRGKAGSSLLADTSTAASAFVAANVATPDKIKAATGDVTTLQRLTSGAPSGAPGAGGSGGGGAGGGGSGPGLGTAVVAGVGGFFAWKWWKRRHGG